MLPTENVRVGHVARVTIVDAPRRIGSRLGRRVLPRVGLARRPRHLNPYRLHHPNPSSSLPVVEPVVVVAVVAVVPVAEVVPVPELVPLPELVPPSQISSALCTVHGNRRSSRARNIRRTKTLARIVLDICPDVARRQNPSQLL